MIQLAWAFSYILHFFCKFMLGFFANLGLAFFQFYFRLARQPNKDERKIVV